MSFQFWLNSNKCNRHITWTLLQRDIWKFSYSLLEPRMASIAAFCCNITFIWISLVSFAAIINCVTFYYICIIFCFNWRENVSWNAKNSLCRRYQQLCQWQSLMSPQPKKVGLVNFNQAVIFCNIEVIVHKEFISLCQTVSLLCYWKVLQHLRKQVCWKLQEWWWSQNWLAHHMPPYTVLSVQWFLAPETWLQFLTFCIPLIWLLVNFSFFW